MSGISVDATARLPVVEAYERKLRDVYGELGLVDIWKWKGDRFPNGPLAFINDATRFVKSTAATGIPVSTYPDEVASSYRALMYSVGMMALNKPYMADPKRVGTDDGGNAMYGYGETLYAARYMMHYGFAIQSFYNLADRMGDIMYDADPGFFGLDPKKVYFGTVVEKLRGLAEKSPSWLVNFKDVEYLKVNKVRISEVHYATARSQLGNRILQASRDSGKLGSTIAQRNRLLAETRDLCKAAKELIYHSFETVRQLSGTT